MCEHCCKSLWVKISYTILFSIIFGLGLLVSLDVFLYSYSYGNFNKYQHDSPLPVNNGITAVDFKTKLLKIPVGSGYINAAGCVSAQNLS